MGVYDSPEQRFRALTSPEDAADGGTSVEDYKPFGDESTVGRTVLSNLVELEEAA